jgi:hypothetical protein
MRVRTGVGPARAVARAGHVVSALMMESPVITVYNIAPNAAAAMVPIAYSTVADYTGTILMGYSDYRFPQRSHSGAEHQKFMDH